MTASHADPGSAADTPEARALLAALPWVVALVRRPDVAAGWRRASALAGYTVGGLVGHLHRAVERTVPGLDEVPGPDAGPPARLTDWYLQNRFDDLVGLDDPLAAWLRDDGEALGKEGPAALADRIEAMGATLAARLATEPPDRAVTVVRTPRPVPLADYLASRVVEVVVHGDDLVCSLDPADGDEAPEPPARAVEVATALLLTGARQRCGDRAVLRALTRAERVPDPADVLRVL